MKYRIFRIFLFCSLVLFQAVDSRAQQAEAVQEGILGPFDARKAVTMAEQVIADRTNLFSDDLPIYPAERHVRRARQEAQALAGGYLANYFAVYYIFPEEGSPVVMPGILMPASETIEGVHLASMHFKPDEKTVDRIRSLPASTLVYGVDGTGNKGWWPLEYFVKESDYAGYYSARGLYAYTYRPSSKLTGRYGNTAFYLDILDPALIPAARVIPEDNITVLTDGNSDEIVRVAQYSKAVFFNKIIPLLSLYPEYAEIPYEIAFVKPEGKAGSIELRVPAGLPHHHSGDSICIAPAPGMFDALEQYRAFVVAELYSGGKTDIAKELWGYELTVSHFNEAGELDIIKVPGADGKFEFCSGVYIRPEGDEQYLHVYDFDDDMSQEGIYVFIRDKEDPLSEELFGLIESHLAGPCYGDWPPVHTVQVNDWTEKYDTVLHGINKLTRASVIPENRQNLAFVEPDKLFELDVLPDFYGRGIAGFGQWLNENIEYPPFALANGIETGEVLFEFIVGSDGNMYNLDILDASHMAFVAELLRVLSSDYRWTPGEISGFPVNVKLQMLVELYPR